MLTVRSERISVLFKMEEVYPIWSEELSLYLPNVVESWVVFIIISPQSLQRVVLMHVLEEWVKNFLVI